MRNRIFYCLKKSIKIFFNMLLPKSLLIIIILFLIGLILITNKVEASTINEVTPQFTDGRYHTFHISDFTYNETDDTYECDFYAFLGSLDATTGNDYFWSAKIPIPASIYNQDRWVLHLVSNGSSCFPEIVVIDGQNSLYIGRRGSSYDTLRVVKSLTGSANGLKRYQYLNWTGTFNLVREYTSNDYYVQRRYWQPNGILYCKNCRVQFYDYTVTPHNYVDYTSMTIRPNIDLQNLSVYEYNTSTLILDLGYFHDESIVNGDDTLTKVLQNINVSITDLDNDNVFTKDLKLSKVVNVDENGNFYIDFAVWDISTQLGTGNYLISIEPIVKTTVHNGTYFTDSWLDYNTIINYTKYYKFTANNGYITNLTETNSEGSPINPPDEPSEPEQDSSLSNIDNNVNNINNFLNDTTTDDVTLDDFGVGMPTIDNAPDLNNIFYNIYDKFTQVYEGNYYHISFGLPNGDNFNYDIPTNMLSRMLPSSFVTIYQCFWWVLIGGYVLKKITEIIHNFTLGITSKEKNTELITMNQTEYVLFHIL